MKTLLCYTRVPVSEDIYSAKLAYSMHLAIKEGDSFNALNHNSGVLYVKAIEHEDGSLTAKSIKLPNVVKGKEDFYVFAVRTEAYGEDEEASEGKLSAFKTKDLIHYTEIGLVREGEELESGVIAKAASVLDITDGMPEGAVPTCVFEVSDEVAKNLTNKLLTPVNVSVEFPEKIEASSADELSKYKAVAKYSDGSECLKKVHFDLSGVDFSKPGEVVIKGKVDRPHYEFPVAINRADPCIGRWQGKYYFIATNDADNNHTLYIRESDTIEGLVNAEEHLILDSVTYEGIGNLLWAPEFHEINGRLYIFHAATPEPFFSEESHVMALKEGGNPINKEDWERPKRVVKADGTDICEMGKEITLDMTCFEWEGSYYVCWSQRQFLPKDLGAWLYFAKLNNEKPWMLASEPFVLSKPEYGWANNHTFVDEGPFTLIRGDRLFLTFSSAAIDSTYVVSMLSAKKGDDLLNKASWTKTNYPLFSSRSVEGEYGTGHNAYVEDEDGVIWNTYHARKGVDAPRSSGIRRVHFGYDGEPVLDMTEDLDVKDEFMEVSTTLVIK